MTVKEIYKIWAPTGRKWVDWVRPVPFVAINECVKMYDFSDFTISGIDYIDNHYEGAALIVDLPGVESVKEGIALARHGYRPIPIYNGTIEQPEARATVDNQSVAMGLALGAEKLAQIEIRNDALPAFLVDSNRMNRFKMEIALFDNSWDVYHQDLPSAEYFLENGIQKIIVIGETFSKDLKKILYGFQKKKIEIFWTKRYGTPTKVTIHKPLGKDKD